MTKQGYSVASVENIQVAAGQPTDITNVTLQSLDAALLAKIHGKISLNARDDAEGTVIRLLGTGLNRTIDVSHPDETSFSFDDIPSGSYVLQVSHADYYQKEVAFMVSAGSTDLDLGTITLENYEYFADGILATEMTLSPGSHQLAYSSKTDNEIYIVDVSGSNFNDKITNGAYAASGRGMSWSSDGGTILYVKKNPNLADRPYRLCMVSSSGGTITQFESYYQDVMQPAFAPSGSKLVYTKYEDAATYGIFEVDLVKKTSGYYLENSRLVLRVKNDQISLNQLSSVEYGLYERILYSKDLLSGNSSATDPAGIYTLPVNAMDNIDLRFRVFVNDGQNVNSATFSPTNDKIAYCVSGAGTNLDGTYVAYIDGQRTERISTAYGTSLDYDSSGKNLYLIDGRDGNVGKLVRVKIPSKWL
jgi:Tol biopolymer transport system component